MSLLSKITGFPSDLVVVLSENSASSSDSETSEGADSVSGVRMRKKRKHPTRLMTVKEMKTVRRSLSGTNSRIRAAVAEEQDVSSPSHPCVPYL